MGNWILLLIVAIIASLFVFGVNSYEDDETDLRVLRLNAIAIADLESRLESCLVKLKKVKTDDRSYVRIISDIKYRVKKLEGTVCDKNEFECENDKYQCVSEILACDGIKDCKNGRDEDPKFCDISGFKASAVYSSWTPISSCIAAPRTSVYFTNYVISVKKSKIFPPLVRIVEKGEGNFFGRNVSMIAEDGYIMLGTRRAVAFSKSGGGSYCQYVEDSFDRMYCDSYTRGSRTPCMRNVPVNKHYPSN